MRNLPVLWFQGMFLRPQCFQAADRHWDEYIRTSEHWDHAYNYGVRKLEISSEALANFSFQINACEVRLKDGTLVAIEEGQDSPRLDIRDSFKAVHGGPGVLAADLKDAFANERVLRVYLGVPKLRLGSPNVAPDGEVGKHRFGSSHLSLQDEILGGDDQEVRLKRLNMTVLLSTQDLSGYEVMQIAQVERSGEREAVPTLDPRYFPPSIAIDAWPPLGRDIVRAIYDIIGKFMEVLSEQVVNRGIGLNSQEPGDLDRIMMLKELNSAYAVLGVLAFAEGVHPLVAYVELCRIIGDLSIYGKSRRVGEVPTYDHDDLWRIFHWAKETIESLLQAIRPYEYEQRAFVGWPKGMEVTLETKWLNADWQWFVGVKHEGITDQECQEMLERQHLDWKLGSKRRVEEDVERGIPALTLKYTPRTPRALPVNRNWNYYEVTKSGPAWIDVQQTQTLAMRLVDRLILNRHELVGARQVIVNYRSKRVVLEFSLFAVHSET